MTARKQLAALSAVIATSVSLATSSGVNAAFAPALNYTPISVEEIKKQAATALENAQAAGRLEAHDVRKFTAQVNSISNLSDAEQAWAHIEATAQTAKDKHPSLNNLIAQFQARLNTLQKQLIVPKEGWTFYTDRMQGIERIKKLLTVKKDHMWIFWDYVALAIDLSSVQERLTRALSDSHPELETLDDLILRTDNYMARNDVSARMLTTYKSFEVEPDNLQNSKHFFYQVLCDKAHSKITTPEVRQQLFDRLKHFHYEAGKNLPTEAEIDGGILEVKRLLDAGAKNGHLSAMDDVRIQHELELIKQLKKAYPGPNPGVDLVERELRMEEVRFMSLDLRFLQDWLGRILRKDGEVNEGREQVLRVVRRTDLAYFSHRITKDDALGILAQVNTAIQDSHNDKGLTIACQKLEGKLDMMVSDFSMVPARTGIRYAAVLGDVNKLRIDQGQAASDLNHAQTLVAGVQQSAEGPEKYGMSIVAATELELIRHRIAPLLQAQGQN